MKGSKESDRVTEPGSLHLIDPKTGKKLRFDDKQEDFEKITKQTPRDLDAERAFIEGKIEMVLADSHLSEEEKKQAIQELERKLSNP